MQTTAVRAPRPGIARRTTRRQWRDLALIVVALTAAAGLHTWFTDGPRLEGTAPGIATVRGQWVPSIVTDELIAEGGPVTIEAMHLADPDPGMVVAFQVARGPCGWNGGVQSLPDSCDLGPIEGVRIEPGEVVMLVVTSMLIEDRPVQVGDIVINYRSEGRRLSTRMHASTCISPIPMPNVVCA